MGERVITVMTANVGAGLASVGEIEEAVRKADADIIAFEELPREQGKQLTATFADRYPASASFGDGHEGRGILSRYPLTSAHTVEIATGRPDVVALVDVDGLELTVVVAHPRPQKLSPGGLFFAFGSLRQMLRLGQNTVDSAPAVLLGDFNMTPRHPGYARLRDLGLVDAFGVAGKGLGLTFPTRVGVTKWSRNERIARSKIVPLVRFDYVWCTPDITVEAAWIGPDTGADHATVMARLRLPQDDDASKAPGTATG